MANPLTRAAHPHGRTQTSYTGWLLGMVMAVGLSACGGSPSATDAAPTPTVSDLPITTMPASLSPATTTGTPGPLASVHTVFIIMMESDAWASIYQNPKAPYINSLLPQASYATNYHKPEGTALISLPQYIWLEAGSDLGIRDDENPSDNSRNTSDHLVALLDKAGVSWRAYLEDIPGTDCPTYNVDKYAVRHEPFAYFQDVTSNPSYCTSHLRPYSELANDLANQTTAQYNFITPNLCHDMHDKCPPLNDTAKQGDAWLKDNLPAILDSQTYKQGGAVFLTEDNDDASASSPIMMIVLSPYAKGGGYHNAIYTDHSSLLRTVQEIFGVRPFLGGAGTARDLSDLFKSP